MRSTRLHVTILAALTLAALALRFWRLGATPLFGDEAYYLLWADRLAPAYFDHPAGIAFLLKLSTLLGGRSELGVRWLNALLSTACVPLAYAVGRRYVSGSGGLIAAAAVAFGPVYVITGRVAYPDTLQAFLLLVNLLALAPLLEEHGTSWRWGWFGLTLALFLNVKLSSGFYGIALVVYVLGWRRDLLRQPGLWLAAGLAALGLIPAAGWNLAHDWGMVRWAIYQGRGFDLPQPGRRASLAHAWRYLTPPAGVLAGLAAATFLAAFTARILKTGWRLPGRSRRATGYPQGPVLLPLVAACLILPVVLSAANSPRNLGLGLLALWPLAGLAFPVRLETPAHEDTGSLPAYPPPRIRRFVDTCTCAALRRKCRCSPIRLFVFLPPCLLLAVYGLGTAAALSAPTRLPHNIAAPAIRSDAAGWPEFARGFSPPATSLPLVVDYSIAGQIAHYCGCPIYSSAEQFRLWGIPDFSDLTVLSLTFIPPELITARLRGDFDRVSGPETWRYEGAEVDKSVYIWQAQGRRVSPSQVLDDLDYLRLAQQAAIPLH